MQKKKKKLRVFLEEDMEKYNKILTTGGTDELENFFKIRIISNGN